MTIRFNPKAETYFFRFNRERKNASAPSTWIVRGFPVSKILGHNNVTVTEKHYGHMALSELKEAVDRIDGIIRLQSNCSQPMEAVPENDGKPLVVNSVPR